MLTQRVTKTFIDSCIIKARYTSLEPLMLWASYRYLEDTKKIDYTQIISNWMRTIANYPVKRYGKGFASELLVANVLLANVLVKTAKELKGSPLTDHELFSDSKNTFLKDYTLLAEGFQHDDGGLWKDMLRRKRTDILVIPPSAMRPDLFGLLQCIPATPSHQQFGDHFIPLTAGCKLREAVYLDNYHSTDFWNIFTINGQIIPNYRKEALDLIKQTFST